MELTVAGRVLYDKAQQILTGAREAREAVAAISGLERGSLSIGTCASLNAFFDLPLLLGEFHAQHPAIEIRLCNSTATTPMAKVKGGDIDLAFLPLYEKSRDLITTPIATNSLVVACPGDHPLAGRSNVALHSLAAEDFVDFQLEQGTRRIVDRAFAGLNVSRKTGLEVGDVQVLLDLVARGFGIALVPHTFARTRAAVGMSPKIGIATLKRPGLRWELVAAFHGRSDAAQSRNPTVAAFTEVLRKVRGEGR